MLAQVTNEQMGLKYYTANSNLSRNDTSQSSSAIDGVLIQLSPFFEIAKAPDISLVCVSACADATGVQANSGEQQ